MDYIIMVILQYTETEKSFTPVTSFLYNTHANNAIILFLWFDYLRDIYLINCWFMTFFRYMVSIQSVINIMFRSFQSLQKYLPYLKSGVQFIYCWLSINVTHIYKRIMLMNIRRKEKNTHTAAKLQVPFYLNKSYNRPARVNSYRIEWQ